MHVRPSKYTPNKFDIFLSNTPKNQYSFLLAFIVSDVHKVHCSENWMKVDIALPDGVVDVNNVYLEGMKGIPNPKCQPTIIGQVAQFNLPLVDLENSKDTFFECGVTRVRSWTVR